MKGNRTPIGRIPSLGYKECKFIVALCIHYVLICDHIVVDLYAFYTKVQKLGGYDSVTANRLWKSIFDDLVGNHSSTSAATVIRRHYERYESIIETSVYK